MTKIEQLQSDINDVRDALKSATSPDEINIFTQELADLENDLAQEQANQSANAPASTPSVAPPPPAPTAFAMPQSPMGTNPNVLNTIVSTMKNIMTSGVGSGLDSQSLRIAIDEYFKNNKIQLDDLDNEIFEEIKKNSFCWIKPRIYAVKY